MFDESVIVQSAVSAFNNAALVGPAFLWHGILCLPLFVLVYFCDKCLLERLGWTRDNMVSRSAIFTVSMIFVWMILFGGNYSVLRDQTSVLPFLTASVMFMISLFVSSNTRQFKMPQWRTVPKRTRLGVIIGCALVLLALVISDMHAWWGPLLQICAFLFGCVLGRRATSAMPVISGSIIIMLMCSVAILMQPEFFRFGQLGNLTVLHMLWLMMVGILAVLAVIVANVPAMGRIHNSAYVKLKWLMRFVTVLCVALFLLTESVPFFVGIMVVFGVMSAMSVWHTKNIPDDMALRFWLLTLMAFGVVTTMPAITAMGIICWTNLRREDFWAESKFLL